MAGVKEICNLGNTVVKYVKASGKSSILQTKPMQGKVNPKGLGYIFPDGKIKFQNEESALKYIYARLHDALNRPDFEQFERVIAKKGTTIIGQGDGTRTDASKAFQNIPGIFERLEKDVPRDLEIFHSHPDMFGAGRTTPLSSPDMGDIGTFFALKLKKIVAVNSNGEFNSIEAKKDFSAEKFKQFIDGFNKFESKMLYNGLFEKYTELQSEASKYFDKGIFKLPDNLKEEMRECRTKISEIDKSLKSSEKVAKVLHQYYQKASEFGMEYTTNFSNLA